MKFKKYNNSIYFTLGIIIFLSVSIIVAINSIYAFKHSKEKVDIKIKKELDQTVASIKGNISDLIESYSINDYENIIKDIIQNREIIAIVIEDFKMGQISGTKTYVTGSILVNNKIEDYDQKNSTHKSLLKKSYYHSKFDIRNDMNKIIGNITFYISYDLLNKELDYIVYHSIINSLVMSFFLIIILFITIHFFIVKKISNIVKSISKSDDDGVPIDELNINGPYEIQVLTNKINKMINTIKSSREELKVYYDTIQIERDRFNLAIDGTNDGLWDWNLKTGVVVHSKKFETMLGYSGDELPNTIESWSELLHPEDINMAYKVVNDYLAKKGKGVYENKFRMRTKSGDYKWVTGRGKALFDSNGIPLRFVGFNTDITQQVNDQLKLEIQKNTLQYQANHDALTNLANRALFSDRLEQLLKHSKRNNKKIAVLFIDLDHFKEINDSLGHRFGDKVLVEIAQRLKNTIRSEDTLARLGGDEFVIIMHDINTLNDSSTLASKIIKSIEEPMIIHSQNLYVGASIGISLYPDNGDSVSDLLKFADAAMYKAKQEGRNNYQYYTSKMTESAFNRVSIEYKLRNALINKDIIVYYQPQVDLLTNKVVGLEALVRWNRDGKIVSPGEFIHIAESSGLIVDLDRYVLKEAMIQTTKWEQQGFNVGLVSVNLTMRHIHEKDFLNYIDELLLETKCQSKCIGFEITETQIMSNPQETVEVVQKLKEKGFKISLDDFGTGYSSLSYLKQLPIDKLKIDISFIKDLPYDKDDVAIVKAIIALAQNLNITIIAEGVELDIQKNFLLENGCNEMQGYLFSKPISSKELEDNIL